MLTIEMFLHIIKSFAPKLTQNPFWIQSSMGETLRLSKVEDEVESVAFTTGMEEKTAAPEVLQKDHVITYNNVRYPRVQAHRS